MPNLENLEKGKDTQFQSGDKAVESGRAGGIASGEAKRAKRDLRQALEMLLDKEYKDSKGNTLTGTEVVTLKLFEKASKGDIRAFETLRDTIGQKPVDKVMIAEVEQSVIDEVEKAVYDKG